MLKLIKNLLKDKLILIAITISILILVLSLIKTTGPEISIVNIDKAYHGFAYFTMTILWLMAFYKKPEKKYLILLGCIIFGIIIEVLQNNLTNYRTGDFFDVIANSLGSLLAFFIFGLFFKKK